MNFMYIIAGSIILILAWHLGAADSITTTIASSRGHLPDHGSDRTGSDVQQLPLYR